MRVNPRIRFAVGLLVAWMCIAAWESGTGEAQERVVMRIANVTPATDPTGVTLADFERAVEERTSGQVDVQVFNDGVLGGEFDTLDFVQQGTLESMLAHGIVLWQPQAPELAVEELPFLFPSREDAYAAVDGEFGAYVSNSLSELGFVVLAYWENGYRHFTNSERSIVTPGDMAGLKFRSAESAIRLDMFRALGASAIPMAFPELYTALQQGTVDGQENPLSIAYNARFYEVQPYLSLSGHLWGAAPFVVNQAWWAGLREGVRSVIREEAMRLRWVQRERVAADDERLIAAFEAEGVEVAEIDREAFIEATETVWERWAPTIGNDLMGLARRIRSGTFTELARQEE